MAQKPLEPVTVRGRHVSLEPLRLEHAGELWPAAAERDIWRFMIFDVAKPADLGAWIALRLEPFAAGTALPFVIRDAESGTAIGSTSLFDINLRFRTMEVGHTWIGPRFRRTSANTEAKRLILGYAFEALGAIRVQLKCDERNVRSAAAIERIGAKREGTIRNQMVLPDGHRRNAALFSVIDSEWPVVRAKLDKMLE